MDGFSVSVGHLDLLLPFLNIYSLNGKLPFLIKLVPLPDNILGVVAEGHD